jgi:hypothetical protein
MAVFESENAVTCHSVLYEFPQVVASTTASNFSGFSRRPPALVFFGLFSGMLSIEQSGRARITRHRALFD